MAVGKRTAAAVLDGGNATQGSTVICGKERRIPIGSTADYEDPSCLGEGGFGCVVKARHRVTGKNVAIKLLRPPDDTEEPANVGELYREAHFLDACRGNPYIIGFHGLVRNPTGDLGLAMEYVGPSLEAFLRGRTPLPEATVRSFMLQLLTGAKKMQEHKIVHRDIKPANVLVAEGGKLKICDLGLAMSMSEPTPYAQAGTMFYMAPEMLLGKPDYDALVDSWSLGCVMAELFTGRGKTLFRQNDDGNEIRQLWTIFHVLGKPDDGTWPEFTSLPFAAKVPVSLLEPHSRLRELFPKEKLSKEGFEVLEGLLTCNPDKRLTAAAALELPWFAAAKVDTLASPTKEVAAALPEKRKLRVKVIPPATPMKQIEVATALPTKKVLRIKIKPPKTKKNVLKIPLALWNEAHRL